MGAQSSGGDEMTRFRLALGFLGITLIPNAVIIIIYIGFIK